jgi:hypothetical protein
MVVSRAGDGMTLEWVDGELENPLIRKGAAKRLNGRDKAAGHFRHPSSSESIQLIVDVTGACSRNRRKSVAC